jgi:hypothetical protein
MIKKFLFSIFFIFLISFVYADSTEFNIVTSSGFQFSEISSTHQKAQSLDELNQMIQNNEEKLSKETLSMNKNKKFIYENQNKVRNAIYSLLSMESLIPSVGILVSDIARQLNGSVQKIIIAEEKIQKRNFLIRFFAGGDKKSADEIETELKLNEKRISDLETLKLRCECSGEIKNIFEQQIQIIKEEQNRLQRLIDSEKSSNGLFG